MLTAWIFLSLSLSPHPLLYCTDSMDFPDSHLIHPYYPSLYCTDSMDFPLSTHSHHSSLLPGLPNCILYPHRADVSSCWLANTGMFICQCPLKNIANEFIFVSSEESYVSCSSWMVFEIGGKWPYSCCFVGCCFQNLFKTACSILVLFLSSLFSIHLANNHTVHPYNSTNTFIAWKKSHFILSNSSDFHMINNLLIKVHTFARCILKSLSVEEILLPSYVNWSATQCGDGSFSFKTHVIYFICIYMKTNFPCCLRLAMQ